MARLTPSTGRLPHRDLYDVPMAWLLVALLVLWVFLAILGFVIKGLMWLAWVAIILVAITIVIMFVAKVFSND